MRFLEQTGEMNIQECRNVTEVKQADVTEINRSIKKHGRRNHPERDEVPSIPNLLPILHTRNTKLFANDFLGICRW